MAIVNGVITTPDRLAADLAAALGVTNYNLSYLCGNKHGKTRPWARYKDNGRWPYPFVRSGENAANFVMQGGKAYWQDIYGWCGMTPNTFTTYQDVVNFCNGGLNGWVYQAPTGGESSPYHLPAFVGYKHAPRTHEGIGWVTLQGSSMTEGDTGVALIFSRTSCETYDLGYNDFAFLQSCRFGAYLKKISSASGASGGASAMRVIAAGKVVDNDDSVTLSGVYRKPVEDTVLGTEQDGVSQQLTAGTWEIYPFLFSEGTHYSIPYANKLTLEVRSKSQNITIVVSLNMSTGICTIKATNNTSSSITLNNNSVQFRLPTAKENDSQQILYGESQQGLTNATLAAGASKTWTAIAEDFANLKSHGGGKVQVIVNLSSGTYKSVDIYS